jgi:hypothetical protein
MALGGFKPTPKTDAKKAKAKRKRQERAAVTDTRALCVVRDGYCRLHGVPRFGPCGGAPEWAHLKGSQRFETRGKPAHERHNTEGSLMLCSEHHRTGRFAYDLHRMSIYSIMETLGADGPLQFVAQLSDGTVISYQEPSR